MDVSERIVTWLDRVPAEVDLDVDFSEPPLRLEPNELIVICGNFMTSYHRFNRITTKFYYLETYPEALPTRGTSTLKKVISRSLVGPIVTVYRGIRRFEDHREDGIHYPVVIEAAVLELMTLCGRSVLLEKVYPQCKCAGDTFFTTNSFHVSWDHVRDHSNVLLKKVSDHDVT